MLTTIADAERKTELQNDGRWIGPVRGDGDCLIASLLEGLVYEASLLPLDAVQNALTYDALCKRCRSSLVALPVGDVRKPMLRDNSTGAVVHNVEDSEHDSAYLQCDIHAEFILSSVLYCNDS